MNLLCDSCTYTLHDVSKEQIDKHIEMCGDGEKYVFIEISPGLIWRKYDN